MENTAANLKLGRADLAINYDLGLEGNADQQVLYTLQPHVICSKGHEFAWRKTIRLEELHRQKLILLDQPWSSQYVLGFLRARGAEVEVVMRAKSFELHRSLVANSFGIALVHTLPESNLSYDGLPICAIPVADTLIEQKVLLTSLGQNRNRPVLKAILAEVATLFSESKES